VKKIAFLTAEDVAYGFKLTGVSQYTTGIEKTEETLKKILRVPDTGLVIIDERLLKGIDEEKLRRIEKTWEGIMLILPSPERARLEVEDYAARLIRRAIGYHVRLRL
jgi:V/A-type H+-transporting ATPase subunit F